MSTLASKPLHAKNITRGAKARVQKGASDDFLMLCTAPAAGRGMVEAVYALYYLPRNYKLMILTDDWAEGEVEREEIASLVADEAFKGRVSFERVAGAEGQTSPFSFADVVIYGSEDTGYSVTSARQISLRQAASPEALASAVLKAGRS